jgi:hypothetical protein
VVDGDLFVALQLLKGFIAFFFSNFKGTPSQEEHKTIFSSLKISKMALSGQSDATGLFSAVRYTLCDTYIDFPFF